jgi:hypothetical protein
VLEGGDGPEPEAYRPESTPTPGSYDPSTGFTPDSSRNPTPGSYDPSTGFTPDSSRDSSDSSGSDSGSNDSSGNSVNGNVSGGVSATPPVKTWFSRLTDAAQTVSAMGSNIWDFAKSLVSDPTEKYTTLPPTSVSAGADATNKDAASESKEDDPDGTQYWGGISYTPSTSNTNDERASTVEVPSIYTDPQQEMIDNAKKAGLNPNNKAVEGLLLSTLEATGGDPDEALEILLDIAESTGGNLTTVAQNLALGIGQDCEDKNCKAAERITELTGVDQDWVTEQMKKTAEKEKEAEVATVVNVNIEKNNTQKDTTQTTWTPTSESDAEIAAAKTEQDARVAARGDQTQTTVTPVITNDKMTVENTVRDFNEGIVAANDAADKAEKELEAAKKAVEQAEAERNGESCGILSFACAGVSGLTGGEEKLQEANDALAKAQKEYDATQAALVAIDAGTVESIRPSTESIEEVFAKAEEVLGTNELTNEQKASLNTLIDDGVLPDDIIEELDGLSSGDALIALWKVANGFPNTESEVFSSDDDRAIKIAEKVVEMEESESTVQTASINPDEADVTTQTDTITPEQAQQYKDYAAGRVIVDTDETKKAADDAYLSALRKEADAYTQGLEKKAEETIKTLPVSQTTDTTDEGCGFDIGCYFFGKTQEEVADPQSIADAAKKAADEAYKKSVDEAADAYIQEQENRVANSSSDTGCGWNVGCYFFGDDTPETVPDEDNQTTKIVTETTPDGAGEELFYYVDGKKVLVAVVKTNIVGADSTLQTTDCSGESGASQVDCIAQIANEVATQIQTPTEGSLTIPPELLFSDGISTNIVETPSMTSLMFSPESISDIDVAVLDNDVQVISIPARTVDALNIYDTEKIELGSSQTSFVSDSTYDNETLDSTNFQDVEQDLKVILPTGQKAYETEQGFPVMSPGELFLVGKLDVSDKDLEAINLALRGELPGSTIRAVNNGATLTEADLIEIDGIVTTIVNRAISRNTSIYDQVFKPKAYSSVTVDKRAYTVNDKGFEELVENLADGSYAKDYGLTNIEPDELAYATHYYSADGIEAQIGRRTPVGWDIDQSNKEQYYVSAGGHTFGNVGNEFSVAGVQLPATINSGAETIMLAYAYDTVTNSAMDAIEEVDTGATVKLASTNPAEAKEEMADLQRQAEKEVEDARKSVEEAKIASAGAAVDSQAKVTYSDAILRYNEAAAKLESLNEAVQNEDLNEATKLAAEVTRKVEETEVIVDLAKSGSLRTGDETGLKDPDFEVLDSLTTDGEGNWGTVDVGYTTTDNETFIDFNEYADRARVSKAQAENDAEALKTAHPEYTDVKIETPDGVDGTYTVTAVTPGGYTAEEQAVIDAGAKLGLTSDSAIATLLLMAEQFKEEMPPGYETVTEAVVGTLTDAKNKILETAEEAGASVGNEDTLLSRVFTDIANGTDTVQGCVLIVCKSVTEEVKKELIATENAIKPEEVTDEMLENYTAEQKAEIDAKKTKVAEQLVGGKEIDLSTLDTAEKAALLGTTKEELEKEYQTIKDEVLADPRTTAGQQEDTSDNCNWLCEIVLSPFGGVEGARETLENLAFTGTTPEAELVWSLGPKRPNEPTSDVVDNLQQAVSDIYGDTYKIVLTSGTEGTLPQYGTRRHKTGKAVDFQLKEDGKVLYYKGNEEIYENVALKMAADYGANVGLGEEYMDGVGMHVDLIDPEDFVGKEDAEWGSTGNAMAGKLATARATGIYDGPLYNDSGTVQFASTESDSPSLAKRALGMFNSLFPTTEEEPQETKETQDTSSDTPALVPPKNIPNTTTKTEGNGPIVDGIVDVVSKTGNAVVDFFTGLFGGGGSNSGDNFPTGDSENESDDDTTATTTVGTPLQTIDLAVSATKATQGTGELRFQGSISRSVTDGSSDNELPLEELQKYYSTVIDNRLNVDYSCDGTVDLQKTFTITYRSFISGQNETSVLLSEYLAVTQAGTHCFFFEGDTKNVIPESTETNNTSGKVWFTSY